MGIRDWFRRREPAAPAVPHRVADSTTVPYDVAWNFESDLKRQEIMAVLGARTGWPWSEREKHHFGDYLVAYPAGLRVRIYDLDGYHSDGPTYTLEVRRGTEASMSRAEVQTLVDELLAAVGARHVTRGEPFD